MIKMLFEDEVEAELLDFITQFEEKVLTNINTDDTI